ncbi:hypothetical protein J1N35_019038 [Gossypium stocksii]|uniref:Uncharacterized protein n=1 Tax=Gossypium stocksii TaxID=47602 RepID=A0A9D4A7R3_9ROSI|nr:hypothetical protein J1N35_019038 [Gossypium stocksii]
MPRRDDNHSNFVIKKSKDYHSTRSWVLNYTPDMFGLMLLEYEEEEHECEEEEGTKEWEEDDEMDFEEDD